MFFVEKLIIQNISLETFQKNLKKSVFLHLELLQITK